MSNTFKAQYKSAANQQWQTKQSGSEMGAMQAYQTLKQKFDFARVIDPDGRVVT